MCFLGLCEIQVSKVPYMSCLGKVFERLTNKIQIFQGFKNFRVFILNYRANLKRRKRRKILKISLQWQINECVAIFMGLK